MLARTHISIGLGAMTLILPKVTLPAAFALDSFIAFLCAVTGCIIGSTAMDLDHPESYLSRKLGTQIIGRIMVLGLAALLFYFNHVHQLGIWLYYISIGIAIIAIVSYSLAKVFLPVIFIERIGLIIFGLLFLLINYKFHIHISLSVVGTLFLFMGLLSHRGLTHSFAGAFLLIVAALLLTSSFPTYRLIVLNKTIIFPLDKMFIPFCIGLGFHLIADFFADQGIPLFTPFPKFLKSPVTIKTRGLTDRALNWVISIYVFIYYTNPLFNINTVKIIINRIVDIRNI